MGHTCAFAVTAGRRGAPLGLFVDTCSPRGADAILIVHAHHEPARYNSAMTRLAVEVLTAAGHEVVVSDLYARVSIRSQTDATSRR